MSRFLFIPLQEIARYPDHYFLQLIKLPGCEMAMERVGIIVTPDTPAHIRACLLGMNLLEGQWDEPYEV